MDPIDFAFDSEVLTRFRKWEREEVDKVRDGKDRVEVLEQNSRSLHDRWLETLPPDHPARMVAKPVDPARPIVIPHGNPDPSRPNSGD